MKYGNATWGVGGKAKEYVLSRRGSAKKYESVQGGRGGQKASKLGVRTLWVAPYTNPSLSEMHRQKFHSKII